MFINVEGPGWVERLTGLSRPEFARLVAQFAAKSNLKVADGRAGRQWSLALEDRILLVACYYRTNLTMRELAKVFGVTHSAASRIINRMGAHLALQPIPDRRSRTDQVTIVDGTAVLEVQIDAGTRLVVAFDPNQYWNLENYETTTGS